MYALPPPWIFHKRRVWREIAHFFTHHILCTCRQCALTQSLSFCAPCYCKKKGIADNLLESLQPNSWLILYLYQVNPAVKTIKYEYVRAGECLFFCVNSLSGSLLQFLEEAFTSTSWSSKQHFFRHQGYQLIFKCDYKVISNTQCRLASKLFENSAQVDARDFVVTGLLIQKKSSIKNNNMTCSSPF